MRKITSQKRVAYKLAYQWFCDKIRKHMLRSGLKKLTLLTGTMMLAISMFTSYSRIQAEGEEGDGTAVTYAAVNPYYGGWSNCTWSAWQLCYSHTGIALPRFGNAGAWYGNAAAYGYSVGTSPAPMSIIVWSNHVGFVTEVSEDGTMVYIKEGGYCGGYHEGWWPSQGGRHGQAFYGYVYVGSGGMVIDPTPVITTTTTTVNERTGEVSTTQTTITGNVVVIDFPEVNEDVVRVDNAAGEEPVKQEEQEAKEEVLKENKEQRAAAIASRTKLLCE